MSQKTCENCLYCLELRQGHEIQKQSLCNRYPPTAFPMQANGGIAVMSLRPPVNPEDTCGEYRDKEPFPRLISH